jgi:NAD(P)H-dependent FMN reductase
MLADAIRAADGVIFCTPEYNFSLPGGLKNAIDWVSRLPNQPFAGKPIAIQSASPGPLGGGRVQYDLRRAMVFLDAITLNKPEIFIGSCASKFDDKTGTLKDDITQIHRTPRRQGLNNARRKYERLVGDLKQVSHTSTAWRESRRAEGSRGHAVDHKFEVDPVIGELQEIRVRKPFMEFADEIRRVLRADAE